jgi:hypothetical protein
MTLNIDLCEDITDLCHEMAEVAEKIDRLVLKVLKQRGTYQMVADALGVTRQAAWELYHNQVVK